MERLTIEDAIAHAKEVADMNYNDAEKFDSNDSVENYMKANCMKCAEQHEKLAEWLEELKSYKELEERLHKIFGEEYTFSLADVIDTLEMKLSEPDKKHPVNARILTYEEADKWQEYKNLEEQGLLVRLPCKVGAEVYYILGIPNKTPCTIDKCVFELSDIDKIGESLFLTREEAEKKLEEMKK